MPWISQEIRFLVINWKIFTVRGEKVTKGKENKSSKCLSATNSSP